MASEPSGERRRKRVEKPGGDVVAPSVAAATTTPGPDLVCVDTESDLKRKVAQNKSERKRSRIEKEVRNSAAAKSVEATRAVLDEIAKRSHAMHPGKSETPLVTPGSGVSKTAYGRKKTHAHDLPLEEELLAHLDRVPQIVEDMDEKALAKLARVHRESLGLETFAEHFTRAPAFADHRPESRVQVSLPAGRRASSSATDAAAPEKKRKKKASSSTEPPPETTATVTIQGDTMKISDFASPLFPPTVATIRMADGSGGGSGSSLPPEVQRAVPAAWPLSRKLALMPFLLAPMADPELSATSSPTSGSTDQAETAPLLSSTGGGEKSSKRKRKEDAATGTLASSEKEERPKKRVRFDLPPESPPVVGADPVAKKLPKKAQVKLTRPQSALVEMQGKRAVTADEARFVFDSGLNKTVKAKPVRGEYLTRTETPPSGNESVRAARRDYLTSDAFNLEASKTLDQAEASVPSTLFGALNPARPRGGDEADELEEAAADDDEKTPKPPTTSIMSAMETRHIAVVDEAFFEPSEAQKRLLRKGDRTAIAMAATRRLPSRLPKKPIEGAALRELEQGRPAVAVALENAQLDLMLQHGLAETGAAEGPAAAAAATETTVPSDAPPEVPLVSVSKADVRQPLYRYFEIFGKTKRLVADDMVDELIFDYKDVLFSPITKERLYATRRSVAEMAELKEKKKRERQKLKETTPPPDVDAMDLDPPAAEETQQKKREEVGEAEEEEDDERAAVTDLGVKMMHKNACQRARNLKRQREPVGRQAESEPQRMRSRIADARVAFQLERWNLRDFMFRFDHPELLLQLNPEATTTTTPEGREKALADLSKEMSKKREALLKATAYGPLAQLLERHRRDLVDRGPRTGTKHFVSAEELGSARIHPSFNPSLPRARMAYHLAFMEEPRAGERECINGHECYCYKGNKMWMDNATFFAPTNTLGFVCKEWLLPAEKRLFDLNGTLPTQRRRCIVCILDETTRLIYANERNQTQPVQALNDHCVYVDEEDEYASSQCWHHVQPVAGSGRRLWTGIIDAFPMFNEGDYRHDVVEIQPDVFLRCMRFSPTRLF